MKSLSKAFIYFLLFILLGWGANTLAFLLPSGPIHENVIKSGSVFIQEGAFPHIIGENYHNTIADNNTDAWMLLMADYDGNKNLLEKSLGGWYNTYENTSNSGMWGFDNFVSSTKSDAVKIGEEAYSRYWHGWMLPLRILLLFFSYENIRYIGMNVLLALLIVNFCLLLKFNLKYYAIAFFAAITFVLPISAMISFEYAFIFYIMLINNIILLTCHKKIKKYIGFHVFFMYIGISCAYFDFLTYPLVALAFCLMTYIFIEKDTRLLDVLLKIILNSIAWAVGYFGMWFSKWGLSTIVLQRNVFEEAINQLVLRTSTTDGLGSLSQNSITYLDVLKNNLTVYMTRGFLISFIIITIYFLGVLIKNKLKLNVILLKNILIFIVIGCMPFAWSFVFKNHTYLHRNFTCNIFSIVILAYFSFYAYIIENSKSLYLPEKKDRW